MTQMPSKSDKPNDPPYAGGEDEVPRNGLGTKVLRNSRPDQFPVDETDNGPPTAPDDTGEGP
jgi:hypothetical protein